MRTGVWKKEVRLILAAIAIERSIDQVAPFLRALIGW